MAVRGWRGKYLEIAREFKYDRRLDYEASIILDHVAGRTVPDGALAALIGGRTVFVVGAGPSLGRAVPVLKGFGGVAKIAADSAVKPLIRGGIVPDVIVTDLDGDEESLRRCGRLGTIFAVHAHGDNIHRLHLARSFRNRLGTTQSEPYGTVQNFGGFTDGDRAVFLASHFGAGRIVLFGMDYDGAVGRLSGTRGSDVRAKLRKLEKSRELLEWLSGRTGSELLTVSRPVRGFRKVRPADLGGLIP